MSKSDNLTWNAAPASCIRVVLLAERRSQYALINAVQFPRLTCDDAVRKCRGWTRRKMVARGHVVAFFLILAGGCARADYGNVTTVDDSFLSSLIRNCKRPTLSCVQENFYKYVDEGIESREDIDFGGFVKFTRNSLVCDNTTESEVSGKSDDGPLGDIARMLRRKMVKFMMSHDVQLQLPQTFFDGAVFKISPRSLDEDGALISLDVLPNNQVWNPNGEGRIFFKKLSKFRNLSSGGGSQHVLPYFRVRAFNISDSCMYEEVDLNIPQKKIKLRSTHRAETGR